MEKALKEEIEHGSGSVRRNENSFTVELKDRILFDSGSASIKSHGLTVLKRIADSLKENGDKAVRVEGHTDNVPILVVTATEVPFQLGFGCTGRKCGSVPREGPGP